MQVIERRARRHIRQWKITRATKVLVLVDDSCASALTAILVKKLLTIPEVTFSKSERAGFDIVIYPLCADDAAQELLEHFLSSKSLSAKKSLLIDTTQEEILHAASNLGLQCSPAHHPLLAIVRKAQPDASTALAKSARFLKK